MKKPAKKRPSDPNMRMASIMRDVIAISEKPIVAPSKRKKKVVSSFLVFGTVPGDAKARSDASPRILPGFVQ